MPARNLCWNLITISLCALGKENIHHEQRFHLSGFIFSIFRVPLNHQARGTSTWLIIGSNSHTAQPNTFVMSMLCLCGCRCLSSISTRFTWTPLCWSPFYLYTIYCLLSFPLICGYAITENQTLWAVSVQVSGGGKYKHTNRVWKRRWLWRFLLRGWGLPW